MKIKVSKFAIGEVGFCSAEMSYLSNQTRAGGCAYLKHPAELAAQIENQLFADRSDCTSVPLNTTTSRQPVHQLRATVVPSTVIGVL